MGYQQGSGLTGSVWGDGVGQIAEHGSVLLAAGLVHAEQVLGDLRTHRGQLAHLPAHGLSHSGASSERGQTVAAARGAVLHDRGHLLRRQPGAKVPRMPGLASALPDARSGWSPFPKSSMAVCFALFFVTSTLQGQQRTGVSQG